MTTEIQAEANRRNALQSTGPKTAEGIEAARFNALRHGLRALQTVVPGEAPEEWEAHRTGVVDDLKPEGSGRAGPGRTGRRETLAAWPGRSPRGRRDRHRAGRGRNMPCARDRNKRCSMSIQARTTSQP